MLYSLINRIKFEKLITYRPLQSRTQSTKHGLFRDPSKYGSGICLSFTLCLGLIIRSKYWMTPKKATKLMVRYLIDFWLIDEKRSFFMFIRYLRYSFEYIWKKRENSNSVANKESSLTRRPKDISCLCDQHFKSWFSLILDSNITAFESEIEDNSRCFHLKRNFKYLKNS